MGKKLFVIAGAFCIMFAFTAVKAQDGKFAFFNPMKFEEKSSKAKEFAKKLADSYELKKGNLEKKQKAYLDLKDTIAKQGPMLKEETRNEKIKELTNMEIDLKIEEQKAKESLQQEQQETMQALQNEITKIIKKLRVERGYTLVFNAQYLMSADDTLDITDEVTKVFDAEAALPAAGPKPKPAATSPAGPAKPKPPVAR
jgi:outer membrane protein